MSIQDLLKDLGLPTEQVESQWKFIQALVHSLPFETVTVNRELKVVSSNLERSTSPNQISAIGKHIQEVIYSSELPISSIAAMIDESFATKLPVFLSRKKFKLFPFWKERPVDVHINAVPIPDKPALANISFLDMRVLMDLQFQLNLINELGSFMVGTLDINRLLFLMLTGITAGPALGFNRALIFLLDDKKENLVGALGVGPSSAEEAGIIWSRISQQKKTLQDFLSDYNGSDKTMLPMSTLAKDLSCPMSHKDHILVRTVNEKTIFHKRRPTLSESVNGLFFHTYQHVEFITIPLYSGDEGLGAIIADNRFNWKPIEENQKNLLGIFANLAGISVQNAYRHRKLLESLEKTREATMQHEQADRKLRTVEQYATVGRMAAFVAHEIRNPMATIGGFARSTLKNRENLDKVERNAKIIIEEVVRLEDLLSEVLDYMKEQVPKIEKADLNVLVEEVCEMARILADRHGIAIKFQKNSIPAVSFDRNMMKQAVLNILKNAITFSPTKGSVFLRTELRGRDVAILVKDEGPGIDKSVSARIFEPFFTTNDSGSGLGLTITRRIVEAHRGSISFDSEKGKGSTFSINLPID